ncbi:MAG: universal stress protein [Gemmatimonadales bacterium]
MPIEPRTVTVFLDASPSGAKRAAYAVALAQRWGAHLTGVHVVFAGVTSHPSICYVRGDSAIRQVIVDECDLEAVAEAASILLSRRFRALCAGASVAGEFRAIRRGRTAEEAVLSSLQSDLVVVGHPAPHGLPDDMSPERMLLASGVPLLIVPNAWEGPTIGARILIGWNATRQARRAIFDGMGFLLAAASVTVLVIDQVGRRPRGQEPGADIALDLVRYGVSVSVEQVASHGAPIAQVILASAVRSGSDLLVIGAYSHARLREILLGGTTRTLLARMPVPVLVSR